MLHFTSKEDKMYFMPHVGINFGMGEFILQQFTFTAPKNQVEREKIHVTSIYCVRTDMLVMGLFFQFLCIYLRNLQQHLKNFFTLKI